jgi:hypothetical protein
MSQSGQTSQVVDKVSHLRQLLSLIANSLHRKVFGRNHQQDLMPDIVSQMSVSSLAAQRQQMEDTALDSD